MLHDKHIDRSLTNVVFGPLIKPKFFRTGEDLDLKLTKTNMPLKVFGTVAGIVAQSTILKESGIIIFMGTDENSGRRGFIYSTLANTAKKRLKLNHKIVRLAMKNTMLVCIFRDDLPKEEEDHLANLFQLEKVKNQKD